MAKMHPNEERFRRLLSAAVQAFIDVGMVEDQHLFEILNQEAMKKGYTIECSEPDIHVRFTKMHKAN